MAVGFLKNRVLSVQLRNPYFEFTWTPNTVVFFQELLTKSLAKQDCPCRKRIKLLYENIEQPLVVFYHDFNKRDKLTHIVLVFKFIHYELMKEKQTLQPLVVSFTQYLLLDHLVERANILCFVFLEELPPRIHLQKLGEYLYHTFPMHACQHRLFCLCVLLVKLHDLLRKLVENWDQDFR